ncbi:hypothetical protein [Streptomyces sp. NBC_00525]|uniref:hypothetical protein n=1 Tax=Streptomyces sp. NBC_00525 TaxID=2903660 RepID=UPI002E816E5D|nr:hypothetical protein [Streptomyces sp. NBC_00525]WUC97409.1 hypothetical protein OG710_29015 [Streptomyces sp. NBC_00525]
MGKVEAATQRLIKQMGELAGPEEALGELALTVAHAIDHIGEDKRQLPNLSKELRLALKQLQGDHAGGEDDGWSDLASPE